MERSTIIITICVVLGIGGMTYHFYSEYNAKQEKRAGSPEKLRVKAASEKKKKAAAELKKLQDKEQ